MTDPARRALIGAIVALPACSALGPAAAPAIDAPRGPLPAPTLRVGDRWRYRLLDVRADRVLANPSWELVEISPELRMRVTSGLPEVPPFDEVFASAWSARAENMYGHVFRFDAPVPIVPVPIEAGRGGGNTTVTHPHPVTGKRLRWSQRLVVGGWESVEVPAGRFDALHIDRRIAYDHPDGGRNSAWRIDSLWYAPRVGRWVRREQRGDYISDGTVAGAPAEGVQGRDDVLRFELTAFVPSPVAG